MVLGIMIFKRLNI